MVISTQDLNQSPTWEPVTRLAYCHFGQLVSLVKYVCIDVEYDQLGRSYSTNCEKRLDLEVYMCCTWLIRPVHTQVVGQLGQTTFSMNLIVL